MLNMIKADLFRIFKGKGIYVVILFLVFSAFMSAYSLSPLSMGLNLGDGDNAELYNIEPEYVQKLYDTASLNEARDILQNHADYSLDVANIAKNNNLYYVFIALIIFVIGCDFSNKTIKNTISTNISKSKYYFSKLILALGLGTVLIFLNAIFCHVANIILNGNSFSSPISEMFLIIIKQLPLLYAIISILVTISVVTRRTSIYNGITIPMVMVFQLIFLSPVNVLKLPSYLVNYEWETALTKLCLDPSFTYLFQTLGLWTVIFVTFVVIGYNNFKARDI